MSYTIQINEAQRAILAQLLLTNAPADVKAKFDGTPEDEALALRDMFIGLPADEREMVEVHGSTPGQAVHGFCL